MSTLDFALKYAARGWRVLPCAPGTKIPACRHGSKDATTDVVTITHWWTENPNYNVAIATGQGLYVVDIDDPASPFPERLPPTLTSRTPRGGSHHVFTTTEHLPNTTKKLAVDVDTRGEGGYIVVAPSQVDGRIYTWTNDLEPAPLPEWLAALVRPRMVNEEPTNNKEIDK